MDREEKAIRQQYRLEQEGLNNLMKTAPGRAFLAFLLSRCGFGQPITTTNALQTTALAAEQAVGNEIFRRLNDLSFDHYPELLKHVQQVEEAKKVQTEEDQEYETQPDFFA